MHARRAESTIVGAEDLRRMDLVHPLEHQNPAGEGVYKLVVIGAGAGGLVTAAGAAGLGARVALIEKNLLGGDCLNVGCVPSKALIASARAAAAARRGADLGLRLGPVEVDFPAVMERMRRLRADIAQVDSVQRFQQLGVEVFLGEGRFVGPREVEVGGRRLRFQRAVIATGGRPALPPIPGLAEARPLTNLSVFDLESLPRRLLVLGAGPIGCELAQCFARFGAEVTLVDAAPQVLPREAPEAAALVARALERDGLRLRLGVRPSAVRRGPGGVEMELEGEAEPLRADELLVAAGRRPHLEGLGLEAAGVERGERGLVLDDGLRSSNPRVYAVGDVAGGLQFTHAADAMARLVIRNALFPGQGSMSALTIPWCTYTEPEIAQVGLSAEEAARRGQPVDLYRADFAHLDRAILEGEAEGYAQVVVRKGTDLMLGAMVVGPGAGDLISEAALAMQHGLGLAQLAATVHPYPTRAEIWRKVADAWSRTRLTPMTRRVLGAWLELGR